MNTDKGNVDPSEIAKFTELSSHWWDTNGQLRMLHQINPLRLQWINERSHLEGKTVIDIGCGGGILTEGMAKMHAHVTGIDMSQGAINIANLHQIESGVQIEYLLKTAEKMALERPMNYDIVTCMEMLEHVPDPIAVMKACSDLVKPGGHVFFSTLNRNIKSYLFGIIGAEYILKLVPQNTHDYAKFIRPSELADWSRSANLTVEDMAGLSYNPFSKQFSLTQDISINYLVHLTKN